MAAFRIGRGSVFPMFAQGNFDFLLAANALMLTPVAATGAQT
jgi:hypothetical protein